MDPKVLQFDWLEYTVLSLMLGISAFIGVFFGFIKKKGQDTVDGYLLGGKEMGVLPISLSLVASFISGIAILGLPVEVYTFGTQYMVVTFCFFTNGFLTAYVFLPVFYKLQLISLYQYMEMRFSKKVRTVVSFLYLFSLLVYIPIVIYGPALALNQVSGMDVYAVSAVLCTVCIFYTTVGGLKAVVWTDTVQCLIMILAASVVAVVGSMRVGGIYKILEASIEGDRAEFFNLNPDPRIRATFWSVFIGYTIHWTGNSSVDPSAIQKFVALRTLEKAKRAVINFLIGCSLLYLTFAYMGLVIYAKYQDCDPKLSGKIQKSDQMLPYFILDVAGNLKGLSGIFLAGIICAALSTMSAAMNTVSGTIYKDFIEPIAGNFFESRAAMIMKFLVVIFGLVCLSLVLVIEKLGQILELSNALGGLTNGTILGMFVLGMFFPQANSTGASVGGILSLLVLSWIMFGARSARLAGTIVDAVKPVSVAGCSYNITLPINDSFLQPTADFAKVFPLFEVSFFYYSTIGCTIVVVVGLVVSYLTGPTKAEEVDRDLLSPLIYRFLKTYSTVPTKETELAKMSTNPE